jgi:hypothetical protein
MIQSLGETDYFIYHEEDRSHTGYNKVYLINKERKSVDSILKTKQNWVPIVDL